MDIYIKKLYDKNLEDVHSLFVCRMSVGAPRSGCPCLTFNQGFQPVS